MSYRTDVEEYFHVMGLAGVRIGVAREIQRHAQVLQRTAVAMCNRPLTDREIARSQKAKDALREMTRPKDGYSADSLWSIASIDGDPRGYVVKLHMFGRAEGKHNTMGGLEVGWAVPAKDGRHAF